ncbi:MAG: thioesterase family protein [Pseudomonadales bacterium]|nr:thioesterase family protein [Pseudomonadales bacterium]
MSKREVIDFDLPTLMSVESGEKDDQFIGQSESYGMLGIYGGHFVGQALAAGFSTVDENKLAQSLHAYFLRKGDPDQPIVYKVKRLREGRGSDTRSISAFQSGQEVFHMIAAYKLPEEGDSHQKVMPQVISPETLEEKLAIEGEGFKPPMMAGDRATLLRISDTFMPSKFEPGLTPQLQCWMRSNHSGVISKQSAQCVLAFLSDGTLMFNSVIPFGVPFQTHRLTSLDHSVWFHHICDVSDWMLFDQRSTAAADGRGMNEGEAYDQTGKLIYTTSQESMLRRV